MHYPWSIAAQITSSLILCILLGFCYVGLLVYCFARRWQDTRGRGGGRAECCCISSCHSPGQWNLVRAGETGSRVAWFWPSGRIPLVWKPPFLYWAKMCCSGPFPPSLCIGFWQKCFIQKWPCLFSLLLDCQVPKTYSACPTGSSYPDLWSLQVTPWVLTQSTRNLLFLSLPPVHPPSSMTDTWYPQILLLVPALYHPLQKTFMLVIKVAVNKCQNLMGAHLLLKRNGSSKLFMQKLLSEKANIAHNLSGDEQGKAWGGCTIKVQNF